MMQSKWTQRSCFVLALLLTTLTVNAGYQIREFETARALLYLSFDNASLAGYWKGQTPLVNHQAQITSGALGNSCVAPQLNVQLQGNINPKQGTISFFTKISDSEKPLMQIRAADGQCLIQIGKAGTWLRPWITLPSSKAIGREADTHLLKKNQWVHLTLVWDQQKGIRFYINGKLASHQWGAFRYTDTRTPKTLKLNTQNGIDELWIFDHPLDVSQIDALQQGRLIPASILAETFPAPRQFTPSQSAQTHLTFVPYTGKIPQWAQALRQLQIQTQQLTGVLNPVAFEPGQPLRLAKGHDVLYKNDSTISSEIRSLTSLWQWYTSETSNPSTPPTLLPKANLDRAMQTLRNLQNGERFNIDVTLNLLAAFEQEGDRRFLNAALTNAQADETQLLSTLGIISCYGKFTKRMLPDPKQLTVTWKNMGNDIVTRVNRVSEKSLHVTFFNFNNQPRVITMRPWSLSAGQYQVVIGPDANDDDMADSIALLTQWPDVHRGSEHRITLPAGQTVIEWVQTQASEKPKSAQADPALHRQWVTYNSQKDELVIPVMNLGTVPADDLTVEVYADGYLIRNEHIKQLPASGNTLGHVIIRYPMISMLNATEFQVRLHCNQPEQSNRNNDIIFPLNNIESN
ncbi:MAG: hypothetical protein JKX85_09295 [Phycisphaeraceae bacterium]|nr:hypothetical protein [Phycisphaeraceae bacterium]